MPVHCPKCKEINIRAPLDPRESMQFGFAHSSAIAAQAVHGVHRTLPGWAAAATCALMARRSLTGRQAHGIARQAAKVIGLAAVLQVGWAGSYAAFSGIRTWRRLSRLSGRNVVPMEITCEQGGPRVVCSAYRTPLGDAWHVEGIFAWPRGRGGGGVILRRLLRDADTSDVPLTLTALSPRTARIYERAGFRQVIWIYWMRWERPRTGSRHPGS